MEDGLKFFIKVTAGILRNDAEMIESVSDMSDEAAKDYLLFMLDGIIASCKHGIDLLVEE